jgi:uncharacterized phage protein (TIGR02218 family)
MSATWLADPLVLLAWCWRLARRDGLIVALTSHDRDLWRGDLLYRAAPGLRPSRIEQSDRIESHSIDLAGAISSGAIRAEDIAAGRWDGAALTLALADWADPDAPLHIVARGELGTVTQSGQSFTAALAGPLTGLDQPVGPTTSPSCRASLGDADCRVALAPLTFVRQAVALDGRTLTIAALPAGHDFAFGRLRWLDGAAAGLMTPIAAQDGAALVLADGPPDPPSLPARVELRAGCDKRLATCAARFANAVNFRGEAHLPGFDLLTRYPGG